MFIGHCLLSWDHEHDMFKCDTDVIQVDQRWFSSMVFLIQSHVSKRPRVEERGHKSPRACYLCGHHHKS
jgi:hypothetical protein